MRHSAQGLVYGASQEMLATVIDGVGLLGRHGLSSMRPPWLQAQPSDPSDPTQGELVPFHIRALTSSLTPATF